MARDSYRAALERIAMGISGREKSGLLPNEIRVHTTGMAKPDWELAEELLALVPPAGPSDEVILDAIVSSAMERGWSPSGSWAVAQGAIKRLHATTRPIEKEKPCS